MIKKLPKKWDETWDVVIVGSGFAGLAEAAEAAGGGAKTVVLEKMPTYGGNSIINGDYAAWNSKFHYRQKMNLGDDSVKQHVNDTIKGGDDCNLPELAEVMASGAAPALNWMIDEGGARIREALTRAGSGYTDNLHAKAGIVCSQCHGKELPGSNDTVENNGCLSCHGPMEKLALKMEPKDFKDRNPHKSHLGDIACTVCHKGQGESQAYCLSCHPKFQMKIQGAVKK